MNEPQTKRVIVVELVQYDDDWPPEPFAEFIAWFDRKIVDVPEQHRATLTVEISTTSSEWPSPRIEIAYTRPETPEEVAHRLLEERQRQADKEAKERATLEALKRKYENSTA